MTNILVSSQFSVSVCGYVTDIRQLTSRIQCSIRFNEMATPELFDVTGVYLRIILIEMKLVSLTFDGIPME